MTAMTDLERIHSGEVSMVRVSYANTDSCIKEMCNYIGVDWTPIFGSVTYTYTGNEEYPTPINILRDVNIYDKYVIFRITTNPKDRSIEVKVSMADYSKPDAEGDQVYRAEWREDDRVFSIAFGPGCDKYLRKYLCRWLLEEQLKWSETCGWAWEYSE